MAWNRRSVLPLPTIHTYTHSYIHEYDDCMQPTTLCPPRQSPKIIFAGPNNLVLIGTCWTSRFQFSGVSHVRRWTFMISPFHAFAIQTNAGFYRTTDGLRVSAETLRLNNLHTVGFPWTILVDACMAWSRRSVLPMPTLHTSIHTCIHPYMHPYMHTCIPTSTLQHTTYHPMPPMPTTTTSATTVPSSIIRRTSCWLARAELAISNSREFRMFVGGHSFIHSFIHSRIQTNGGIWPLDWWTPCFGLRPKQYCCMYYKPIQAVSQVKSLHGVNCQSFVG